MRPLSKRRLTIPSSGCPTVSAHRSPLMSNVRRSTTHTRISTMAGKFHDRVGIRNTIKRIEATNSKQNREGTNFAVATFVCGCSDPACGASHQVQSNRPLPTTEEAIETLKAKKAQTKMKPRADSTTVLPDRLDQAPNLAFNSGGFADG